DDPVPPSRLAAGVPGDLESICLKCLQKDPARRYESALALAEDLERFLHDEPVLACPPSAAYRARKFVRKHRAGLAAAAALAVALLGGSVVSAWQAVLATRAEAAALASADAERRAKETAQAREAETRAVLNFVENKVFAAARPAGQAGGRGWDVT